MKKLILLFVLLFLASCNTENTPKKNTDTGNIANSTPNVGVNNVGNTPQENFNGSPNGGPYYHKIYFAREIDSVWSIGTNAIQEHASVPDLILLEKNVGDFNKGDLITYFVDASGEGEKIGIMSSSDGGVTWSEKSNAKFSGIDDMIPVDPSIVQLETGSLRLYFYDISNYNSGENKFYVAKSDDGINFELEQEVFSRNQVTDPEVIDFNDLWYMYISQGQKVLLATSEDGLNFEYYGEITKECGVPGALVDNGVYVYCHNQNGINEYYSSGGYDFEFKKIIIKLPSGVYVIADSGPVLMDDGSKAMIIKEQ